MPTDRERWNERHREAGEELGAADPFVAAALPALGPGAGRRALDVACGRGRHTLLLAELGWQAEGWDVSDVALERLEAEARRRGLEVRARQLDLGGGLPPREPTRALVVVVDFLDRALLSELWRLVEPGGHAVVATFTRDWPGRHPSHRFRLGRNELAAGLPGLETVSLEERGGRAGIVARRAG